MTNKALSGLMQMNNAASMLNTSITTIIPDIVADPVATSQALAALAVIQTNLTAVVAAVNAGPQPPQAS